MSLQSNNLLNTIKSTSSTGNSNSCLANVVSFSDSELKIKFYGDDAASQKNYKRLSSYSPAEGDTVLVINVNGSYVVIGKVE